MLLIVYNYTVINTDHKIPNIYITKYESLHLQKEKCMKILAVLTGSMVNLF